MKSALENVTPLTSNDISKKPKKNNTTLYLLGVVAIIIVSLLVFLSNISDQKLTQDEIIKAYIQNDLSCEDLLKLLVENNLAVKTEFGDYFISDSKLAEIVKFNCATKANHRYFAIKSVKGDYICPFLSYEEVIAFIENNGKKIIDNTYLLLESSDADEEYGLKRKVIFTLKTRNVPFITYESKREFKSNQELKGFTEWQYIIKINKL